MITEDGNLVVDAKFVDIQPELENQINCITGVVENGLFVGTTEEVIVARDSGVFVRSKKGEGFEEKKL